MIIRLHVPLYLFESVHLGIEVWYVEHPVSCVQSEVVDDHHSVPDTAADHQRFERLQQVTHTVHLKVEEGGGWRVMGKV